MQSIQAQVQQAADGLRTALSDIEAGATQGDEDSQPSVYQAIDCCLSQLAQTQCWGRDNHALSNILWNATGSWMQRGWLQNRARTKPLGYAGDHELLNRIIDHWTCDDPLGCIMDQYFQDQAAPQAVRNRTAIVAEAIVTAACTNESRPLRVTSIGSGPARDVASAVERLGEQSEGVLVNLLDYDPNALESATDRLSRIAPLTEVRTQQTNLARLPRRKNVGDLLGRSDLIVCTGLYDYLTRDEAIVMLNMMGDHVGPGGQIIIFNFAPTNRSRAYMEWIGNWYLIYRDADEMRELAEAVTRKPDDYSLLHETSEACIGLMMRYGS